MTPQDAATQLVDALVEFDGVEAKNIRSIIVRPTSIELQTYQTDADGHKFITDDGEVATAKRNLPYRYSA